MVLGKMKPEAWTGLIASSTKSGYYAGGAGRGRIALGTGRAAKT
jgi:hypothetical protein